MSLISLSEDLNIISKLPDAPTLTAAQLKAKFDEGGLKIKEYINSRLLPAIEEYFEAQSEGFSGELQQLGGSIPALSTSETDSSEVKAASAKVANGLYTKILENDEDIAALQTLITSLTTTVNSRQKTITSGQGTPSGGSNGDIYLMY